MKRGDVKKTTHHVEGRELNSHSIFRAAFQKPIIEEEWTFLLRHSFTAALHSRRATAAAASRHSNCGSSQNFAAIGALICDPELNGHSMCRAAFKKPIKLVSSYEPIIHSQIQK